MVHRIVVEDQSLRWYGRPPKIADDSIEFVRLQFHLPEDWDPLVLVAQFTQADTYNMLLDGDMCFLPKELKAGLCKLSLFGYAEGKPLRATSIPLVFQIDESGFVSSAETPIPPTPDLYAQLIEYFSRASGSGDASPEAIAKAVEDYLVKNPPSRGPKGEDGKTPVKGVDYWTSEDRQEIIDASGAISYNKQTLTEEQKAQARENIGIPEIVCTVSSDVIAVTDSLNQKLRGLNLYGKTTQNGTPTPESPVELESVGANGNIGVKVAGKNLLPNNLATQTISGVTFTVGEDGTITANGTATDLADGYLYGQAQDNANYLFVPKGTKFVGAETAQSFFIFREKTAGAVVGGSIINPILAERDCYFYGILFRVSPNATVSNFSSKPMLYKQTYSNEYEPYKEPQTLTIQTSHGLPGIPVPSGGNYTDENGQQWISDEIDFARGKYVQRVGINLINRFDSASIRKNSDGLKWQGSLHVRDSALNGSMTKAVHSVMNTKFPMVSQLYENDENTSTIMSAYGHATSLELRFRLLVSEYATADLAAEAISNTVIYYPLATPIETDLTAEEIAQYSALHSNYPNTTIYNDEGAGMAVRYVADTKLYIDNKFSELQNAILSAGANI